jgi:4-diphosphocytidyl-2-C-methyl-D-erythritol kinase
MPHKLRLPALVKTGAKLNLSLKIFSPRADGFHPICSIFQSISLYDTLLISPMVEKELRLIVSNPEVPTDSNNILVRIYNKVSTALPCGFSIALTKNIPLGSGLGGASTNAAGFLLYLNRFLNKTPKALLSLGTSFGADIPFFLQNTGIALVRGIGEKINPISPGEHPFFVLVFPGISSSTPEAYKAFDQTYGDSVRKPTKTSAAFLRSFGENDFKPIIFKRFPIVADLESRCRELGFSQLCLSGSGSTVFFAFKTFQEADHCHTILEANDIQSKVVSAINTPVLIETVGG